MAATDAEVVAMLLARYPQFVGLDNTRLLALAADARLMVACHLTRLGSKADLGLMYKLGSLLTASLSTSASGSTVGGIKKQKDGDVEIEYQTDSASASATYSEDLDFPALYKALFVRRAGAGLTVLRGSSW